MNARQKCIRTFAILAVLGITLSSGCSQLPKAGDSPANLPAPRDFGTAELTIMSLNRSEWCPGHVGIPIEQCSTDTAPNDCGIVRVDNILDYTRSSQAQFETLKEQMVIEARFKYSSRPARIKHILTISSPEEANLGGLRMPSLINATIPTSSGSMESGTATISLPEPLLREDGLYVYLVHSSEITEQYETILTGFDKGNKIRAQFEFINGAFLQISEYEVVN